MRDLTQHLTTRADDNHAAPVQTSRRKGISLCPASVCQALVRFFAYIELNHMLHRLCGPPSIPLSFTLASILPRRYTYRVSYGTRGFKPPTPSVQRLRRGLPGYLILFAPHAFAPQRRFQTSNSPSPQVFFHISTDFTPTRGIPVTPSELKSYSLQTIHGVKLRSLNPHLYNRLRALYAQ